MSKVKFHIGCSSFATPSWKSIFYPDDLPKKDWFTYYCKYFNTYEFNGSFYRFPTVSGLQKWYDKTPHNFTFSIKIPKTITHTKKLIACEQEINDFYTVVSEGLSDKLGCVLWQFPPSFVYNEENLNKVVSVLNGKFKNVVEFRHESWWNNVVVDKLKIKQAVFCNRSYPGLPEHVLKNNSCGYFRQHGIPKLFYSEYSLREIETLYKQILAKNFDEVYVYFNNTASPAAVINATQFMKLVNH
ncbi:MAG: DUF72 domain-containing protein [Flavobacterium sp.]